MHLSSAQRELEQERASHVATDAEVARLRAVVRQQTQALGSMSAQLRELRLARSASIGKAAGAATQAENDSDPGRVGRGVGRGTRMRQRVQDAIMEGEVQREAKLVAPVRISPIVKLPVMLIRYRYLVVASHFATSPVFVEVPPVTVSPT